MQHAATEITHFLALRDKVGASKVVIK